MDWKKIGKKLLFPPIFVMLILTAFSTAALVFVFVEGLSESVIAYITYVISFYTLTVLCLFFSMVLPKRYKVVKQKIYDHPFGNRYMTDAAFRTHISLYSSLGMNLLYVGVNLLSYVLYKSMWFICLAVYYIILAAMRFLLARYATKNGFGKNRFGELKRTVVCSYILLTVNFALSGAVLMILYQDKGYEYHGILIYVMALYTFYITTHAIVDLVKYRKYKSPVMTMSKIVCLSAATVSMLSLETAMFSQFGQEMSLANQRLMIALTGAGVSVTVVTLSIYMIVKSTKEIKELRGNGNGKQRT